VRRKYRVRARPKVRLQRRSLARVFAGLAAASLLAVVAVRAKPWTRLRVPGLGSVELPSAARVDSVEFSGVPRELEGRLRGTVAFSPGQRWGLRGPSRAAFRLAEEYPCLRSVDWRRSYLSHSVRFDVSLRTPVAAVTAGGKPRGFLDETGRTFDAPEGLFDRAAFPEVDLDGVSGAPGASFAPGTAGSGMAPAGLTELGRFVSDVGAPGALPARLVRLRYQAEDGWTATLGDGVELLWGRLGWTEQKLGRLREVMADAGPRFGGNLTADLRFFEDGKILVRPR